MKKPSPATEEGPLPGLSETNYKVLAGVTAVGVLAPALLLAQAFIPADFGKKAPPKKGDKGAKPATSKTAPAKKPAAAKMELPKLALPKREKAPAKPKAPKASKASKASKAPKAPKTPPSTPGKTASPAQKLSLIHISEPTRPY